MLLVRTYATGHKCCKSGDTFQTTGELLHITVLPSLAQRWRSKAVEQPSQLKKLKQNNCSKAGGKNYLLCHSTSTLGLMKHQALNQEVFQWSRLLIPSFICFKRKAGRTAGRLLASGHLHHFEICLSIKISEI